MIMVYDFHPDSTTLAEEWLNPDAITHRRQTGVPIPERVIWSYVIQLANALKAVHTAGLAVRCLDATKVLITGKNRIRINGVGILDVLSFDQATPMGLYQQEDLINFGQLIMSLCADFVQPGHSQSIAQGLDYIGRAYSLDLKNLVGYLLGKPTALKTIDEVLRLAGPRILNELDALQSYNDVLESELGAEVENGRIARMLIKLGFINERPEFDMDPQWSESGDRYVLKLFRDYVFHQVGPDGKPVLDLSHVLTTLNKVSRAGEGAVARERRVTKGGTPLTLARRRRALAREDHARLARLAVMPRRRVPRHLQVHRVGVQVSPRPHVRIDKQRAAQCRQADETVARRGK